MLALAHATLVTLTLLAGWWVQAPEPEPPAPPQGPRVAIIIDDMAGGRPGLGRVLALPPDVTLSFLPYGRGLSAQVADARAAGHEVWLHLPMQALHGRYADHPMLITPGFSDADLATALDAFAGYAGVNNHMGSALTQDRAAMSRVMRTLAARGVPFLDSRTGPTSVACAAATASGVPCAERDVFLDDDPSPDAVRQALARLERIAQERGHAIAIGHPHTATLDALAAWLPTLPSKGVTLVPASALLPPPGAHQARCDHLCAGDSQDQGGAG